MILRISIPIILILIGIAYIGYNIILKIEAVPEIHYGEDKCDNCGMIISEKPYSAIAFYKTEDRWVKFDDLGELFIFMVKHGGYDNFEHIYVFDFKTGERIDALKAYFVKGDPSKIWTPMSSGIVAFKERNEAINFAQENNATVYSFNNLYMWVYNNPDKVFQMANMNM